MTSSPCLHSSSPSSPLSPAEPSSSSTVSSTLPPLSSSLNSSVSSPSSPCCFHPSSSALSPASSSASSKLPCSSSLSAPSTDTPDQHLHTQTTASLTPTAPSVTSPSSPSSSNSTTLSLSVASSPARLPVSQKGKSLGILKKRVSGTSSGEDAENPPCYLCWFLYHNDYNGFRLEELEALARSEGGASTEYLWRHGELERPSSDSEAQFVYCQIPSEEIAKCILKKSILIRAFIEVWAEEDSYPLLLKRMQEESRVEIFQSYINDESTWAFRVKAFGKSLSAEEQRSRMNFFSSLFKGTEKVDLQNPDVTLAVVEEWIHSTPGNPLESAPAPQRVFFGREIASRHNDKQPWWWSFRLPIRPVLGPTSLDTELAFLMCHQAQVRRGHVVLDPFVGTGSILVSATHYGAFCIGSDIDIRVLKGYSVAYLNPHLKHPPDASKDVFRNFEEYGLPKPEIVRCDNAAWIWRLPPGVKRANDAQKQDEEKETNGISCGREKRDLSSSLSPPVSSTASVPSPVQAPRGENCELNGEDRSRDATASSLSTSAGGGDENELKSPPRLAAYLNRTSAHSGRPWVDAVITDPPYGIRAGARQSGHQKKHKRTSERTNEERLTYISPTVLYEPQSVISDLMNLAARLLVDGGRLVFLLPVEVARAEEELQLLSHQDFQLVGLSLQPLAAGLGRYLVTMTRKSRGTE